METKKVVGVLGVVGLVGVGLLLSRRAKAASQLPGPPIISGTKVVIPKPIVSLPPVVIPVTSGSGPGIITHPIHIVPLPAPELVPVTSPTPVVTSPTPVVTSPTPVVAPTPPIVVIPIPTLVTPIPIVAPAEVPPSPVVTTVSDNNAPATELPALPPGTAPHVVEAVQSSFDQGTLTQQEAEAVSQLYAPLYNPTVEIPYEVRDSSGVVVSTTATVVDFGTAEAAQAALDAYYNNFVGAPPPEPEPAPTTGSSDGGQSDVDAYLASLGY